MWVSRPLNTFLLNFFYRIYFKSLLIRYILWQMMTVVEFYKLYNYNHISLCIESYFYSDSITKKAWPWPWKEINLDVEKKTEFENYQLATCWLLLQWLYFLIFSLIERFLSSVKLYNYILHDLTIEKYSFIIFSSVSKNNLILKS